MVTNKKRPHGGMAERNLDTSSILPLTTLQTITGRQTGGQTDRQKKPLIGARACALPKNQIHKYFEQPIQWAVKKCPTFDFLLKDLPRNSLNKSSNTK